MTHRRLPAGPYQCNVISGNVRGGFSVASAVGEGATAGRSQPGSASPRTDVTGRENACRGVGTSNDTDRRGRSQRHRRNAPRRLLFAAYRTSRCSNTIGRDTALPMLTGGAGVYSVGEVSSSANEISANAGRRDRRREQRATTLVGERDRPDHGLGIDLLLGVTANDGMATWNLANDLQNSRESPPRTVREPPVVGEILTGPTVIPHRLLRERDLRRVGQRRGRGGSARAASRRLDGFAAINATAARGSPPARRSPRRRPRPTAAPSEFSACVAAGGGVRRAHSPSTPRTTSSTAPATRRTAR